MIKVYGYMMEEQDSMINTTKILFPDKTPLIKMRYSDFKYEGYLNIVWKYESEDELVTLIYLVKHLESKGIYSVRLIMPYIPNARMDRVKNDDEVFTLKYFCDVINWLEFDRVLVLDPHSYVSEGLINNIQTMSLKPYIKKAISKIPNNGNIMFFYPDEGAMKRYSDLFKAPYAFGIKKRDWATGKIEGLDIVGEVDRINGRDVLILDDICSKGGTAYYSALKLKELGANKIYLYVTHCENTIFEGELLEDDLIEKVFTTDSIFTKEHEKIEVIKTDWEDVFRG
jgi:ribose-phosphate pyrophosphokinase